MRKRISRKKGLRSSPRPLLETTFTRKKGNINEAIERLKARCHRKAKASGMVLVDDVSIDVFENVIDGTDGQVYRQSELLPPGVKQKGEPYYLLVARSYAR
jgi:hypothetical protein